MALFLAIPTRTVFRGALRRSLFAALPLPLRSLSLVTVCPSPARPRPSAMELLLRNRRGGRAPSSPLSPPRPMDDRLRISAPHSKLHLSSLLPSLAILWMRVRFLQRGSARPLPSSLARSSLVRDVEVHFERKNGRTNAANGRPSPVHSPARAARPSSCMNSNFCRESPFAFGKPRSESW